MAQDFNTMTPGSAVSDTLQQILLRRKEEARQKMLDDLNAKNLAHQQQMALENLSLDQQKLRQSQSDSDRNYAINVANALAGGADVDSMDPEVRRHGMAFGKILPTQPPAQTESVRLKITDPDTSETIATEQFPGQAAPSAQPTGRRVLGDNTYEQNRSRQEAVSQLLSSVTDPLTRQLILAGEARLPNQAIDSMIPRNAVVLGYDGKSSKIPLQQNDVVTNQPQRPVGPAESWTPIGLDQSGAPVMVSNRAGAKRVPLPEGVESIGPRPGTSSGNTAAALIPPTIANAYVRQMQVDPDSPATRTARESIIVNSRYPTQVKAAVDKIMEAADQMKAAGRPVPGPADFARGRFNGQPLPPEVQRQVADLVGFLLAPTYLDQE